VSLSQEVALKTALDSTAVEVDGESPSFRRRTVIIDGPDPIDKHVGGQLRLRRAQIGMTQSDLGGKLGLSFQAVQKYETGENRISASRLYQLSRVLEVSMGYFFEGLEGAGESDTDETMNSDLSRKEAAMVLGTYYRISDPRLRSACLLIMGRMADRADEESA
jgi:transcriptional regulator with XRE-family HTH domain